MATVTVRMSDDLRSWAAIYAKSIGVSVNALMVVALRDYLALRSHSDSEGSVPSPVVAQGIPRNAPCPCGSGKKYKRCCGQ